MPPPQDRRYFGRFLWPGAGLFRLEKLMPYLECFLDGGVIDCARATFS
jgi:hypothetical protein